MISVIIPSYNRSKTIERSARSVLNQTIKDLELIIVDDCSTDDSKSVIESIHDNRLIYIKLPINSGACVARNRGIEEAKGEYIAFQDSDDEWVEDKLEKQLKALLENNVDVCFCCKKRISVSGNKWDYTQADLKQGVITYQDLYSKSRVSTQTIFAKREVLEQIKFDEKVKKAQDFDWSLRAGRRFKFFYLAEPLVNQYLQNDSLTIKGKNHKTEVEMCEYFYTKYQDDFAANKEFQIALLKRLAGYKTLAGMNTKKEYKELYRLTENKKYLMMSIGSNLGILSIYKNIKKSHENKMMKS